MSTLRELRTELADALVPLDLNTYTHIPGRLALPGAFVKAGAPYICQGQTFGEKLVRYQLVLAVETGENNSETTALDDVIEAAQKLLEQDGWSVEEVSEPFSQAFANAQALVTQITVTTTVTFP